MALFMEHVEDCELLLGDGWHKVHKWLDAYVKEYPIKKYNEYHRRFRHHKQGVRKIRKMWGFEAEQAAIIHLVRDANWVHFKKPLHKMKMDEIYKIYEEEYGDKYITVNLNHP